MGGPPLVWEEDASEHSPRMHLSWLGTSPREDAGSHSSQDEAHTSAPPHTLLSQTHTPSQKASPDWTPKHPKLLAMLSLLTRDCPQS